LLLPSAASNCVLIRSKEAKKQRSKVACGGCSCSCNYNCYQQQA